MQQRGQVLLTTARECRGVFVVVGAAGGRVRILHTFGTLGFSQVGLGTEQGKHLLKSFKGFVRAGFFEDTLPNCPGND